MTSLIVATALRCGGGRGVIKEGGESPSNTLVHIAMESEMDVKL